MTDQSMTHATFAGHTARLLVFASAVTLLTSCGDLNRSGKSPSYLIIDSLTASSGAQPGNFGDQLNSDVQTLVPQQIAGAVVRVPTVFNDLGSAQIRFALKNAGTVALPNSPTTINQVTLTRYHVEFKRADGRNEPGRDVPFGFDGGVTKTVNAAGVSVTFDIVRHTNKEEPPLRNLIGAGGQNQINTIAEITFYGKDQAGNDVSVTGTITVNFADFGDPS